MDLLRQVLARLPLDTLIEHDDDLEKIFRIRARVVNRFSEARLEVYRRALDNRFDSDFTQIYSALCTYQGELSKIGCKFVYRTLLLKRAAFLREVWWCRHYSDGASGDHLDVEEALRSDIPEIQARALAISNYPLEIEFPESINWTKGLTSWYYTLIPRRIADTPTAYLAGYLQVTLIILGDDRLRHAYDLGSTRRRIAQQLSEAQTLPGAQQLSEAQTLPGARQLSEAQTLPGAQPTTDICVEAGYFPPWLFRHPSSESELVKLAVAHIQPKLLRRLQIETPTPFRRSTVIRVTEDLAQRAREMALLVRERYPGEVVYRMEMEALGGLHVDMAEFGRLSEIDRERVADAMTLVSHPYLPPKLMVGNGASKSLIYYDIASSFHKEEAIFLVERICDFYISGRFLESFEKYGSTTLFARVTPGKVRDRGDVEARYGKILAHLGS